MDEKIDVIEMPECPACNHDLGLDAIESLAPTYVSSDDGNLLTCGHCGDFRGESLTDLLLGWIFEL